MAKKLKKMMVYRDKTFNPVKELVHGDLVETDEYVIEVIHTPGHASNHLCFLIKEANCILTGDHIMNCLLYTSPSPRDYAASRMPSSA